MHRLRHFNSNAVSMQVAVDVDAIKWSLCNERTPFFASALSGLKLAMTRNEDNSGKQIPRKPASRML